MVPQCKANLNYRHKLKHVYLHRDYVYVARLYVSVNKYERLTFPYDIYVHYDLK